MTVALPRTLKAFNITVGGKGNKGIVSKITLPKQKRKMEDLEVGGVDGPLEMDMGEEKLIITVYVKEINGGLTSGYGANTIDKTMFRLKGSVKSEDETVEKPVQIIARGRWTEVDYGDWEAGKPGESKYIATLTYYKEVLDGVTIREVDKLRGIDINHLGVDILEARRSNID